MAAVGVVDEHRFLIRPNCSLNGRQACAVYLLQVGVGLGIAGGFAAFDLWPILPFAGLELLALGACLYLCMSDARRQEVIQVQEVLVIITKSRHGLTRSWLFQRGWAQVKLLRPRVGWYSSRLVIRSHGNSVTLGAFLNEEQRVRLAADIGHAIDVQAYHR